MRYFKRGWTMVLLDDDLEFECRECGIFHADNRLVRKFGIDLGLEKETIDVGENERTSYLKEEETIVAIVKEKLVVEEENVTLSVSLKALEDIDLKPKVIFIPDISDMMTLRGFSSSRRREFKRFADELLYESDALRIRIRLRKDLKSSKLEKGDIWSGFISVSFEIDFKRKPHSEIFSKTPPSSNLLSLGTRLGSVPAAGLPWYSALFGRDLLIYSLQIVDFLPDEVKRILEIVSKLQAKDFDTSKDAQPGKIFHEMRFCVSSLEGENPFDIYYGTVDATLLYPIVVWEYYRRTKDEDVKHLINNVDKAIEWALRYGDLDGDGFVEYSTEGVLRNKGWKDSNDGVVHPDGRIVEGPIALVEVQGYLYGALISAYSLHEAIEGVQKDVLLEIAKELRESFRKSFKVRDYFAFALDGEKSKVETPTSNPANTLFTGIYSKDDANLIVDRIFKDDLMTPFGVRTLSSSVRAFNPISYHRGSIWPHDNSLIFLGLVRYGYIEEAKDIARRVLRASEKLGYLPELYSYVEDFGLLPYPGSCKDQLWAVGAEMLFERKLSDWGVLL